MKLAIKLGKNKIGELEVSTIPGISHKFEFNKKWYIILKTSKDSIEVSEVAENPTPEPGKPGEE